MDPAPPFDLNQLRRDWIVGVRGSAFFRRVERRIAAIRKQGMAAHTRGVLIVEPDPLKFAAAFFAAVHERMPVILANPRWGRLEWTETADQLNPAVLFGPCPLDGAKRKKRVPRVAPSTILIPTGGTSGGVRFAIHRWETLEAACEGLTRFIGPGPVDSCCVLPLFHVSGLMQLMRSFTTGGRIAFCRCEDLQAGRFPKMQKGSLCLSLVPTQLQRLIGSRRALRRLLLARAIFLGGSPAPEALLARARELRLPLFPSYGMTETAAMVAALPPDEFLSGSSAAGRPLGHVKIDILSEGGKPCGVGTNGRIRIKGRSIFKGYHGRGRTSPETGHLTDDEGFIDPHGRLHVIGRRDRLVISGGEKIDPQEVEQAILETGAVEQALVLGWPDPEWGRKLVAFYVTAGVESDPRRWESELRAELAHYKVPKLMIQVKMLPLDARGKVDRRLMERLIRKALDTQAAS